MSKSEFSPVIIKLAQLLFSKVKKMFKANEEKHINNMCEIYKRTLVKIDYDERRIYYHIEKRNGEIQTVDFPLDELFDKLEAVVMNTLSGESNTKLLDK